MASGGGGIEGVRLAVVLVIVRIVEVISHAAIVSRARVARR
jgi:hypothetical protein